MRKDTDSSPTYAHAWKWGSSRLKMIKNSCLKSKAEVDGQYCTDAYVNTDSSPQSF